jgi:hypothetical protein
VVFFVVAGLGLSAVIARTSTLHSVQVGIAIESAPVMRRAPVGAEPSRAHPDLFEGATVRVLDRRDDGWTHIQLVDGARGWVAADSIGLVY